MQKSANSYAKVIRGPDIKQFCKRTLTFTTLHCCNRLYLQHGGGN